MKHFLMALAATAAVGVGATAADAQPTWHHYRSHHYVRPYHRAYGYRYHHAYASGYHPYGYRRGYAWRHAHYAHPHPVYHRY